MNTAVIGLGSNIEPQRNIQKALQILTDTFKVLKVSAFLKTKPQLSLQQSDFINGCVLVETHMDQIELKDLLKDIEIRMGRTKDMHSNQPRVIDLDIHVWNDQVVDPYFYKWDFIRAMVLEVIPALQYDQSKVVNS